jgi:hypothetical protein
MVCVEFYASGSRIYVAGTVGKYSGIYRDVLRMDSAAFTFSRKGMYAGVYMPVLQTRLGGFLKPVAQEWILAVLTGLDKGLHSRY